MRLYPQELGDDIEDIRIPNDCGVLVSVPIDSEFQVTQMEYGGNELASLRNMSFGESNGLQGDFELIKALGIVFFPTT